MTNSIDYSMGTANVDRETGIHYGVIPLNDLASHAFDEIQSNGVDEDHKDFMEQLKSDLTSSIKSALEDYCKADFASIAEEVIDDLDLDYESTGDCTRYSYEKDGTILSLCSDGDIFVIKSPYFAMCSFCSPCAPGAGHLRTEGNVKTYCLGPDWFDSDNQIPYECFKIES
jgi:hypothetical protein